MLKPLLTLLLGLGFVSANAHIDDPQEERIVNLRSQIIRLVDNPDLTYADIDSEEAQLHFFINRDSEVVVLYVDSENTFVKDYLKGRLNYRKIKNNTLRGAYSMKITLKKEVE